MLEKDADFARLKGEKSIGWRWPELPLLYRQLIVERAKHDLSTAEKVLQAKQSPEKTEVVWAQVVVVSVHLLQPNFAGGGSNIVLPVL